MVNLPTRSFFKVLKLLKYVAFNDDFLSDTFPNIQKSLEMNDV